MVETLSLASGQPTFCSTQISDANFPLLQRTTKRTEVDKLCAVHLLTTANPHRHKDLNEELVNASYVGRDECQITPSSAYELLVRRSGRFCSLNRITGRPRNRGDNDQRNNNNGVAFL